MPVSNNSCKFEHQKIFENYTSSETKIMCNEYSNVKFTHLGPISIFEPNQIGKYFNINSDGFRGKPLKFENNDYKIFILGGSTIGGYVTSSDELTIPALLEKKLQNYGLNINVVNAGIGGSTAMDERYYLENYILKYQPDMIIMYDGWNEVQYKYRTNFTYEEFVNFSPNYNYHGENPSSISGPLIKFYTFLTDIDYKTAVGVLNYINNFRISWIDFFQDPVDKENFYKQSESIIESSLEDSWSNVCSLGEKKNFKTINILQPISGTSDRMIPHDEEKFVSEKKDDVILMNRLNLNYTNLQPCNNVYDFRNAFSGLDNVNIFFDVGHMSDFGNDIIAEKIYEKILPVILDDMNNKNNES